METALLREDANPQLWRAYTKTQEYKRGQNKAVPPHHPLMEKQERYGLRAIYATYISKLSATQSFRNDLLKRDIRAWLDEWRHMHRLLWEHILLSCGDWRKKDIRFGSIGDEDLYHIPRYQDVPREMTQFAQLVRDKIGTKYRSDEEKFTTLAIIHYQFIRIHPFLDGNGRIARALTDQLALFFGWPTAMGGYPRHDDKRREAYHKAIRAAADDKNARDLSGWIKNYISQQLELIA